MSYTPERICFIENPLNLQLLAYDHLRQNIGGENKLSACFTLISLQRVTDKGLRPWSRATYLLPKINLLRLIRTMFWQRPGHRLALTLRLKMQSSYYPSMHHQASQPFNNSMLLPNQVLGIARSFIYYCCCWCRRDTYLSLYMIQELNE